MGEPILHHRGGRGFIKEGTLLFVSVSVANVANYLFHLLMTRLLSPADYGALGALFALLLIVSVPTGAVQAVIARRTAVAKDEVERAALVASSLRVVLRIGVVVTASLAVASPLLADFFHLESPTPALLMTAVLLPTLAAPVARGALQGSERFRMLGLSFAVSPLLKFALGATLVVAGMGINGALLAVVGAEILGVLVAIAPLRSMINAPRNYPTRSVLREASGAALALLAFWILVSIDVILARHYFPGEVGGRYAAAALLGRAVLFLPAAVTMVVFPRLSKGEIGERQQLLTKSLALIVVASGAAAAFITAFPSFIVRIFGPEYAGIGGIGALLAIGMVGFGATHLLIHDRIAHGRPPLKTLWLSAVAEIIAIVLFHDTAQAVAMVVLCTGTVVAWSLAFRALTEVKKANLALYEIALPPDGALDLSVIVPSYNGASYIGDTITRLRRCLNEANIRHEVIVVSDGSWDGTGRIAIETGIDDLRVVHYPQNRGKGFALRTGLARARAPYIAFIDSDGDLDPADLTKFFQLMALYDAHLVIGSKRHPLSEIQYPWTRRLMSWVYHKLVRLLFGLKVRDTQTGIKLVRRDVLLAVLPVLLEKRFAFDLEFIVAARRLGYRRVLEAPVSLSYKFASTISASAARGVLLDTAAIWYRRFVLHWYDDPQRVQTGDTPPASISTPAMIE